MMEYGNENEIDDNESSMAERKNKLLKEIVNLDITRGENNKGITVWRETNVPQKHNKKCDFLIVHQPVLDLDDLKEGHYGAGILVSKSARNEKDNINITKNILILWSPKVRSADRHVRAFYKKSHRNNDHVEMAARIGSNEGNYDFYNFTAFQVPVDISNLYGNEKLAESGKKSCPLTTLEYIPLYPKVVETVGHDTNNRGTIPYFSCQYKLTEMKSIKKIKMDKEMNDILEQTKNLDPFSRVVKPTDSEELDSVSDMNDDIGEEYY